MLVIIIIRIISSCISIQYVLDSKSGSIIPSSKTRSLLFQFPSSFTKTQLNAAILLGVIHNSTRQISYRLILINFDPLINSTKINRSLSDELRLWAPPPSSSHASRSSLSLVEEEKDSEQIILIVFIIILSSICFVLVLIIIFLCYRRQAKSIEPTVSLKSFKRPSSAVSSSSVVEKFQAPDLTTKVTLLSQFHLTELDFGTDV